MTNNSSKTISINEFDSALDAMIERGKAHLTAIVGSSTARLPSQATHTASLAVSQEVQDIIRTYCENPMLDHIRGLSDKVDLLVNEAANGKISPDDLDQKLDNLSDKTIQQFGADQTTAKDKLKNCGHEHPDQMQVILNIFNMVSDFILGSQGYQKVINFLVNTVKQFSEWRGKILGWFADEMQTITRFFANLF